jgi:short-subunit dehydrogenase
MNWNKISVCITGADGGIGQALVKVLLRKKVKKIYACVRNKEELENLYKHEAVIAIIEADLSQLENVDYISQKCPDTNVLINNAGIECKKHFLDKGAVESALLEMKVNYLAPMALIQAFLPILQQQDFAYIVNVLSVGSHAMVNRLGTYCASKTAAHLLSESCRAMLESKNIHTIAVYPGYVNTSMSADVQYPKSSPESIALATIAGIETNQKHIFPDMMSQKFYEQNKINAVFLHD